MQKTMFRLLPAPLQSGAEISVCAVLFTQGINEQQTISDRFARWSRNLPSIIVLAPAGLETTLCRTRSMCGV